MNYLLAILAAALLGVGFVLQQAVAEQAPKVDFLPPLEEALAAHMR